MPGTQAAASTRGATSTSWHGALAAIRCQTALHSSALSTFSATTSPTSAGNAAPTALMLRSAPTITHGPSPPVAAPVAAVAGAAVRRQAGT